MSRALLLLDGLEHLDGAPRVRAKPAQTAFSKRFAKLDFNQRAYGGIARSKRFAKLDFKANKPRRTFNRTSIQPSKRFKAIAVDVFAEEIAEAKRKARARSNRVRFTVSVETYGPGGLGWFASTSGTTNNISWVDTSTTTATTDLTWVLYGANTGSSNNW